MNDPIFIYLQAALAIIYGLWLMIKGRRRRSAPRLMMGAALGLVGIALLLDEIQWLRSSLLGLAVIVFVYAIWLIREQGRRRRASARTDN